MRHPLRALRSNRGATAVEFVVLLVLAALLVLGMVRAFGGTVKGKFDSAQTHVDSSTGLNDDGSTNVPAGGPGTPGSGTDEYGNPVKSGDSGVRKSVKRYSADDKLYRHEALQNRKPRSKFGVNPIVIVIILLLVGLLAWVVFKGNSYE